MAKKGAGNTSRDRKEYTLGASRVRVRLKPGIVTEKSGLKRSRAEYLDMLLIDRINRGRRQPSAEYLANAFEPPKIALTPEQEAAQQAKQAASQQGFQQSYAAANAPSAMPKERQALILSEEIRAAVKAAQDTSYTEDTRNTNAKIAEEKYAELIRLAGKAEADRLLSEAAPDQIGKADEPGLNEWATYLRGKPVPFNAGTPDHPVMLPARKFEEYPPHIQEALIQDAEAINKATGNKDPFGILGDFTSGASGPTADWLAQNAVTQQEKARQKAEAEAARAARQAARDKVEQDFREQQEQARRARQAKLDAERLDANQLRAERDRRKDAADLINRNYQWQRSGWGDQRAYARDQQAAADRVQRDADRQAAQQNALQRLRANADARRKQIAIQTAQRATATLARTQVRLESLPQPGGIGLLLIAIVVILFAIQPVNASGATRLQLMWLAILPWSGMQLPEGGDAPGTNVADAIPSFVAGVKAGIANFDAFDTTGGVPSDMSLNNDLPDALQSVR